MPKANDTDIYKFDLSISLTDYLFGTDSVDGKKNKSYKIKDIIQLINGVNGKNNLQYVYSDGANPDISQYNTGYFFTDTLEADPLQFSQLILNKSSLQPIDLSTLFLKLDELQDVVIKLDNPVNPNNFFNFKIVSITNETDYFVFEVVPFKDFYSGLFLNETIYSLYFDIKSLTDSDPLKLDKATYSGNAKNLDDRIIALENLTDTSNLFVTMQNFSFLANVLTINLGWVWKLSGTTYSNVANVNFTIPYCAAGKTRLDYIVPNNVNGFTRISGDESVGIRVAPQLPTHGLYVTFFIVTDSSVGTPELPNTNSIPGLQQVTAISATTTSPITVMNNLYAPTKGISIWDYTLSLWKRVLGVPVTVNVFIDDTTESYNVQFPNKLGGAQQTLAMLSDIPTAIDISNKVDKVTGYSLTKNDFTDTLKSYYDSAHTWVTTNGTNLLNHLSNTSNPHNVTKAQVGLSNVPNLSFSGSNTGDETASSIVTKIGDGTKINQSYLPSYIDDVLEFANLAAFPVTGESGKIYVAIDSSKQYRWTGSVYLQITNGLIATTADVPEGTNLYFTESRVRAAILTGISFVTGGAITAADSILVAFGKLQKQITDFNTTANIKSLLGITTLSGSNTGDQDLIFPVTETGTSFSLTDAHNGKITILTASCTVTIPNGLVAGFEHTIVTLAGVTLTIALGGSVTLFNNAGTTMAEKLSCTIKNRTATNQFITAGSL